MARFTNGIGKLVTCPRSNGHTGAGAPPLADFYASGVRVAVGTDSLASTPDLNIFAELATMRVLRRGNRLSITPVSEDEWRAATRLLRAPA